MTTVRLALAFPVVTLCVSCTTTQITERYAGPPMIRRTVAAPLALPLSFFAHLRRVGAATHVTIGSARVCPTTADITAPRERVEERSVSTTVAVASAVLVAGGFFFYLSPDFAPDESLAAGTVFAGSGVASFSVASLLSGTTIQPLPPERRREDLGLEPCLVHPVARAAVEVVDGPATHSGVTDAAGRTRIPALRSTHPQVFVNGVPAQLVWERPR